MTTGPMDKTRATRFEKYVAPELDFRGRLSSLMPSRMVSSVIPLRGKEVVVDSKRENGRTGRSAGGTDEEVRLRLDAMEREIEEHRNWLRDEPLLQRAD